MSSSEPDDSDEPAESGQRSQAHDPSGLLLAVVAATGIGMLGVNTMPLLLGSLMDELAIGESWGGFIGTVELSALALVSLLLAPRIGRLPRGRLAVLGGCVSIAGYAVSATAEGYALILVGRFVTGAGAGAAMAAGNAAVAVSSDPDGLIARSMIVGGAAAAILLAALPWAIEPWGYSGGFAVLGCATLVCLAFVKKLPPAPDLGSVSEEESMGNKWLGIALILAMLLDLVSQDGLLTFSERIGIAAGMSTEEVGVALAATTLAGLAGAGLAYVVGRYTGRAIPIAIGLGLGAVARWLLANASDPETYWVAQLLLGLAFFLTYPFLIGATAALDRTGRWAAAGAGTAMVGSAMAPVIAGAIVESFGYPALGVLGIAAAAITAALALPVVRILGAAPASPGGNASA